jgi:hypothetical protein
MNAETDRLQQFDQTPLIMRLGSADRVESEWNVNEAEENEEKRNLTPMGGLA